MQRIITRNPAAVQGDWQKQLSQAVTRPELLLEMLGLSPKDFSDDIKARLLFPMRVPHAFIARMQHAKPHDPLLLQVLPSAHEFTEVAGFSADPLDEHQSAMAGLLHKYKNRVLLIVRGGCAINCRYCFRRHFPYQDNSPNQQGWDEVCQYIAAHPEIDEVILSGGDPLMASDAQLEKLLNKLSALPQLKRLRIHTRLPVVIPDRINDALLGMLQNLPMSCVLVTHINHANEIDDALSAALSKLKQAGVTLLNQGVLLKGVNDNADALAELSEALFANGVLPYYLFLLDRVQGAAHFEVSEEDAVNLIHQLQARLPGYLVPRLSREEANKPSKTLIDLGASKLSLL